MKPVQHSVTKKQPAKQARINRLIWFGIIILLFISTVANFHFDNIDWALRAAVGIALAAALIALVLQTNEGKLAWEFLKSSRNELRKVVWPSRQETVQTTVVVVVMVVVTAIFLWGIDALFLWLISFLTGQRG